MTKTVIIVPNEIPVSLQRKTLAELQALFRDPTAGRILIEDYGTTQVEWVIPDVKEILG